MGHTDGSFWKLRVQYYALLLGNLSEMSPLKDYKNAGTHYELRVQTFYTLQNLHFTTAITQLLQLHNCV